MSRTDNDKLVICVSCAQAPWSAPSSEDFQSRAIRFDRREMSPHARRRPKIIVRMRRIISPQDKSRRTRAAGQGGSPEWAGVNAPDNRARVSVPSGRRTDRIAGLPPRSCHDSCAQFGCFWLGVGVGVGCRGLREFGCGSARGDCRYCAGQRRRGRDDSGGREQRRSERRRGSRSRRSRHVERWR
jgi:hypothetical protein